METTLGFAHCCGVTVSMVILHPGIVHYQLVTKVSITICIEGAVSSALQQPLGLIIAVLKRRKESMILDGKDGTTMSSGLILRIFFSGPAL